MKLIKPSFEILEQGPGLEGIYEIIEKAGRTCYKSDNAIKYKYLLGDDEIDEDFDLLLPEGYCSVKELYDMGYRKVNPYPAEPEVYEPLKKVSITAKGFVDRMIASKHYAMLEHGTVYLKDVNDPYHLYERYKRNPYSKTELRTLDYSDPGHPIKECYVSTNLRVLVENDWLDDLQYFCEPTEYHEKRVTVRFTTDRGVSHEFVRHRVFSFAQESTRYCNYSKDKFGNELTFIIPSWASKQEEVSISPDYGDEDWLAKLQESFGINEGILYGNLSVNEIYYMKLLKKGWTPQQARQILPNALKTELVMTGFVSDWQKFFDLRARGTTGQPHPDAKALAEPLMHEFENKNLI